MRTHFETAQKYADALLEAANQRYHRATGKFVACIVHHDEAVVNTWRENGGNVELLAKVRASEALADYYKHRMRQWKGNTGRAIEESVKLRKELAEARRKIAELADRPRDELAPVDAIERLKNAIEGELDGLAIDDGQARTILHYAITGEVLGFGRDPKLPEPRRAPASAVERDISARRRGIDDHTRDAASYLNSAADIRRGVINIPISCPCGDDDGQWCSLDHCPYPKPITGAAALDREILRAIRPFVGRIITPELRAEMADALAAIGNPPPRRPAGELPILNFDIEARD